MIPNTILIVPLLLTPFATEGTKPSDWARFRGPNGTGVSAAKDLPDTLDLDDGLLWKRETPKGFSSPVIVADLLVMTAHEGRDVFTIALDRASSEERWRVACDPKLAKEPRGPNSPVSGTPACDDKSIYVFYEHVGLISYDLKGHERWRHELGPFKAPYGMGTSPVLCDDLVLLLADQDVGSYLLALDKETGEPRFRADRTGCTHSFSSPVVYRPAEGPAEIICSGAYEVCAYSAKDGEKLWWVSGLAWQAKSLPVVSGDHVYVHSWMAGLTELGIRAPLGPFEDTLKEHDADGDGKLSKDEAPDARMPRLWFLYDLDDDGFLDRADWDNLLSRGRAENGLHAIKLGGRGDVRETHLEWSYDRALPNIPSPLLYDGILYVLKEGGIFTALDPATGEVFKQERLDGAVDNYYASPIAADGKIFTASFGGIVAITQPGKDWQVRSTLELDEPIWSTPALADGHVYVRTQAATYCFGKSP